MNKLVTQQTKTELAISTGTTELIQSSIAESTLKRYQRLSNEVSAWLGGDQLTDVLLAAYITELAHYAKAELAERGAVARFFYGKGL